MDTDNDYYSGYFVPCRGQSVLVTFSSHPFLLLPTYYLFCPSIHSAKPPGNDLKNGDHLSRSFPSSDHPVRIHSFLLRTTNSWQPFIISSAPSIPYSVHLSCSHPFLLPILSSDPQSIKTSVHHWCSVIRWTRYSTTSIYLKPWIVLIGHVSELQ